MISFLLPLPTSEDRHCSVFPLFRKLAHRRVKTKSVDRYARTRAEFDSGAVNRQNRKSRISGIPEIRLFRFWRFTAPLSNSALVLAYLSTDFVLTRLWASFLKSGKTEQCRSSLVGRGRRKEITHFYLVVKKKMSKFASENMN